MVYFYLDGELLRCISLNVYAILTWDATSLGWQLLKCMQMYFKAMYCIP